MAGAQLERPLLDAEDLLDRLRAPRARLDRRVVRHQRDRPAVDRPNTGHDPVGAESVAVPIRQKRLLRERALVEQQRDALAHGKLALGARLLVVALGSAGERADSRLWEIRHPVDRPSRLGRES